MMPEQSMDMSVAAMLTISPAVTLMPVRDMTTAIMPPYIP